jgi:hypothetical protein
MFSLRTMLLAVAVVAVGVMGLTTRNMWWASAMSTLTWLIIAGACVSAIVCQGAARWRVSGFTVCAGLYLVLSVSQFFPSFSSSLITNRVLAAVWLSLDVERPGSDDPYFRNFPSQRQPDDDLETYELGRYVGPNTTSAMRKYNFQLGNFFIVGHCLWAMFFGFLGSLFAAYLSAKPTSKSIAMNRPEIVETS